MIVDSSAIVAIARRESGASACLLALEGATSLVMSASTDVELMVVVTRSREPLFQRAVQELLERYQIELVPFTPAQAAIARQAFAIYGQGQGHPAKLNFGDCFAYALARERNEALLFVGDDFIHTDITAALA